MEQQASTITCKPPLLGVANNQRALRLFALVAVACIPALVGRDAVRSVSALFSLADSAHPYFVSAYAGTLYLWTPLVVASVCFLFLSPGLFLSLALNSAKGVGQWMTSGLALSLIVVSAAAGIVQLIIGSPLRGGAFAATVVGCALICFGFFLMRLAQGRLSSWPLSQSHASTILLSLIVVPLILLIALSPKFYWENFNGDGAHAFESARLLLVQALPFWPSSAGEIASFPGVTSMLFAFPTSWFIRLFGEVEAAARLPFLIYHMVLRSHLSSTAGQSLWASSSVCSYGLDLWCTLS